jgi:type III secretion system FlhB-like substrate exporter
MSDKLPENPDDGGNESQETERPVSQKYALGLGQDKETGLTRITSLGRGRVAAQMAKLAREAGIPLMEDPGLVREVFRPADGRVIPARTYGIIAEILTFIYRIHEAYTNPEVEAKLENMANWAHSRAEGQDPGGQEENREESEGQE